MIKFEGYERRIDKIMGVLKEYGIASLEDAQKICLDKGVDCEAIVKGIQPIAFDNAVWAYTVGCAIAIKKNCKKAADAAEAIGIGLQSFCIPGSVAENRKVGLGHGNPRRNAPSRRNQMLRFPCRSRKFRGGRRRNRYRALGKQGS